VLKLIPATRNIEQHIYATCFGEHLDRVPISADLMNKPEILEEHPSVAASAANSLGSSSKPPMGPSLRKKQLHPWAGSAL
jgi:hypothetical protein